MSSERDVCLFAAAGVSGTSQVAWLALQKSILRPHIKIFPYWSAEGGWQAGGVLTAVKSNSTGGCRKKLQYHGRFTCEKIPAASPGCTVKQY